MHGLAAYDRFSCKLRQHQYPQTLKFIFCLCSFNGTNVMRQTKKTIPLSKKKGFKIKKDNLSYPDIFFLAVECLVLATVKSKFLFFSLTSRGVTIISFSSTASSFAILFSVRLCSPDSNLLTSLSVFPNFLARSFCDQFFSLSKASTCADISRFFLRKSGFREEFSLSIF